MKISCSFVEDIPDPEALKLLLTEYYAIMADKLTAIGGPQLSPQGLAAETMAHSEDLLPPRNRLLLATAEDGALMGCGMIRMVRDDAAELKRMFVKPQAQGSGLGRRLFEMRMAEANRMGCKVLYVDTVKGNTPMLTMYERYGFKRIPRYPENYNDAALDPYLVYLELHLPHAT
jgi:GNAT superfamily N-acetyltransferase